MERHKAFTLIELLVVIAIIGILLAVLVPALSLAKDMGKRAVCLAHMHGIGTAWTLYADENDTRIVNAKTARIAEVPGTGGGRAFQMIWSPSDSYFNEPTWVGWWGFETEEKKYDEEAHQACITLGALFPYAESIKVYRCPAGMKDQWRTTAIVDSMNGHDGFESVGGKVVKKTSELESPGTRMVFVDEGYASTESWTIYPHIEQWWDGVPLRHGNGTCFAFADGHAEYRKWEDQRTIDFAKGLSDSVQSAQNNPDFDWLQAAIWTRKPRTY
ncbi:MAG: prepilin-type N-terminal cleavage/methylation domain-containing protein [Sedimentisphaerales bacterium]|nr:prepilin-type N-terminal cleavage/methylation domain-containing protein [Sedimentisphaerales bacterium]